MSKLLSAFDSEIEKKILKALYESYGSLDKPNFSKISEAIEGGLYREVIQSLRDIGAEVRESTDLNDDVSLRLVLDQAGDQVGLALSAVGLFAAILHQNPEGAFFWVTNPEDAPTPFAATVVRIVQHAGFQLLDRSLVSQSIAMTWWDGSTEVTLYQLLFSDCERIP